MTGSRVQADTYQYVSTKEYIDSFPCAYRQWRADDKPNGAPGCNKIHGYSFSVKFYFGANTLDARNWVADYGSLRPLKAFLEDQLDHCLLVAEDDPEIEWFQEAQSRGIAKVTVLPKLGCEGLADMLYRYVNGVFIPEQWGSGESERVWCFRVEVRETQANMAYREGHRSWHKPDLSDLFEN
jgi:6-pyruvoyltetrahydropterin/6-carboxytetrahydropterin synthase